MTVATRGILAVLVATGLSLLAPPPASLAAEGDLTYLGCVSDAGVPGCTATGHSVTSPVGMASAPDGSVYVGYATGIARFTRAADGRLVFADCVANGGTGGCADPALDNLASVVSIAVSADGSRIYAGGTFGVTWLQRNADGSLTVLGCIGAAVGCTIASTLQSVSEVSLSPDGKSLYATSASSGTVFVLDVAPTGALTGKASGAFCLNDTGTGGCTTNPKGSLSGARGLLVPDNGHVYVAGSAAGGGAVTTFTRASDGSLTTSTCLEQGNALCADPGSASLGGAAGMALSPDGSRVYLATAAGVVTLARAGNGALSFSGCIENGGAHGCVDPPADPMTVTVTVAVSPTGSVYTPAYSGNSVTHLVPSGPGLAFGGCVANGGAFGCTDPPQDALSGAIGGALSRDGRYLYVSSSQGVSSFALEPPPDRTAPETTLGKHPKKKTTSKKAKFTFSANEGSTFLCKVDKKSFKPCETPFKVKVKKLGRHKLSVAAVDLAGNVDATPATYKWKVLAKKRHR